MSHIQRPAGITAKRPYMIGQPVRFADKKATVLRWGWFGKVRIEVPNYIGGAWRLWVHPAMLSPVYLD